MRALLRLTSYLGFVAASTTACSFTDSLGSGTQKGEPSTLVPADARISAGGAFATSTILERSGAGTTSTTRGEAAGGFHAASFGGSSAAAVTDTGAGGFHAASSGGSSAAAVTDTGAGGFHSASSGGSSAAAVTDPIPPTDAGIEDATVPATCDGAAPETACGLNGRGKLVQSCSSGQWVTTNECTDPDVCVDGVTQPSATACGLNGRGKLVQSCSAGQWVTTNECTDSDVCVDASTKAGEAVCGVRRDGHGEQRCEAG